MQTTSHLNYALSLNVFKLYAKTVQNYFFITNLLKLGLEIQITQRTKNIQRIFGPHILWKNKHIHPEWKFKGSYKKTCTVYIKNFNSNKIERIFLPWHVLPWEWKIEGKGFGGGVERGRGRRGGGYLKISGYLWISYFDPCLFYIYLND